MTRSTEPSAAPPPTLATQIGDFVADADYETLPAELISRAKMALLDTIGVAMAGSATEGCAIVRSYVEGLGCGDAGASVLGTSTRTLPRFAALANAAAINTYDFDDTFLPSRCHPSGPVLAAVLAEAEAMNASGSDALAAFAIGTEVTCKVSQAISKDHVERGYHITSTCGVIGAAAGVAHLLRSTAPVARAAIGIAASHAAGLRENFGATAKVMHAGHAAEMGVVAASLASLGMDASPSVLEGSRGFFAALGGGFAEDTIRDRLGAPWGYVAPGVAIKLYPSGNIAHPAMGKMLELVQQHDLRPEQVRRVGVRTNRRLPVNLSFHAPTTGLQAQLSMEFCIAIMLARRRAGLAEFTDEVVNSPELRREMAKVEFTTYDDAEAEREGYAFLTTFLDVELHDGRRIAARVDAAKGSASLPVTLDEAIDKTRACFHYVGWPRERAQRCIDLALRFERLASVRMLTELLRR